MRPKCFDQFGELADVVQPQRPSFPSLAHRYIKAVAQEDAKHKLEVRLLRAAHLRLESELSQLRGEEGTHVRRECRAAVGPGNTDIVGLREKLAKAKADNGTLWCTLSGDRGLLVIGSRAPVETGKHRPSKESR